MPSIDHEYLARQTFGDADLARELLALFRAQCRRLVPGIADPARPAVERADWAHTLKGASLGVGAGAVALASAAVEDALRAGHEPDTAALAEAVATAVAEIPPG